MFILQIILIVLLTVAVFFDVQKRRIPNVLTLGGVVMGVGVHIILSGLPGLQESGVGLLLAGIVGLGFWLAGMIGGADHKLLMAVGAFVGGTLIIPVMVAVALAGGAQALLWILVAKRRAPGTSMRALLRSVRLPYSVSIAVGTLTMLFLQHVHLVP